jgi:hypothetical protein
MFKFTFHKLRAVLNNELKRNIFIPRGPRSVTYKAKRSYQKDPLLSGLLISFGSNYVRAKTYESNKTFMAFTAII